MMTFMSFLLALDAGGTSTECVLARGPEVLSRIRGGSIKIIRVAPNEAQANLDGILESVVRQTGIGLSQVCATCVGTAGIHLPSVSGWLRNALSSRVGGKLLLCGDDEIALDAAFPGKSGVLIIAGTGSNVLARTSGGERVNVGGWGPTLSDEGSAYWIGLEGLRSGFRAVDRGERMLFLEMVADLWHADGPWKIVERAHSNPPPDFAALAPIVAACAEKGDGLSFLVLADAGRRLADAAVLAYRKLRLLDPDVSTFAGIAFTGGVLSSGQIVRTEMLESLRRQLPGVPILNEPVDPVMGALWRASQACDETGDSREFASE
jgi:N-acetylglucosamine kinase-like BadF-type ATPase